MYEVMLKDGDGVGGCEVGCIVVGDAELLAKVIGEVGIDVSCIVVGGTDVKLS